MDVDNGASRFDLTLACTELPGTGIHSYFEYNSDLYDRGKVEGLGLGHRSPQRTFFIPIP